MREVLWHGPCFDLAVRFAVSFLMLFLAVLLRAEPVPVTLAELPLQFHEGLLWVEVSVSQSAEPRHFLLDSGASASVVNLDTARRLGLKLGPKVRVAGVDTTMNGYWPVKLSAKASQVELPGKYLALDLGKLSAACNRSVDGLVGSDFFRDRVVEIDYAAQKLRLLDRAPSDSRADSIPLETRRCGLRVPVIVNGEKNQWVRLDTGCATAFQWVTSNVRADKCTSQMAVGFAEFSIPQCMTSIQLGNRYLDTVPTGLHRNAIFPGEAGLLGNGVLAGFGVITIDAKSGRLILGAQ